MARVDADDGPGAVEQRAAAVARVDRGVRLDQAREGDRSPVVSSATVTFAAEAGHDAAGDGLRVGPERAADGDRDLPDLEGGRVADRGRSEAGRRRS